MEHLFCNALVYVIYSRVSGQCCFKLLYTNIDQKLWNKLHGLMNYKMGFTCDSEYEIYTPL